MHRSSSDPSRGCSTLLARCVGLALLIAPLGVTAACEKKSNQPKPAASATEDRYSDGKILAQRKDDFKKYWKSYRAVDPCPLPLSEEQRKRCAEVPVDRKALREVETSGGSDDAIMDAAFKLAMSAHYVREVLEQYTVRYMLDKTVPVGAAPSASGSAQPAPSSSVPPPSRIPGFKRVKPVAPAPVGSASAHSDHDDHAAPTPSGMRGDAHANHGHKDAKEGSANPWSKHFTQYDAVAREAARRLSVFLRVGPLPVRKKALAHMKKLVMEYPKSRHGVMFLREAWLLESNKPFRAEIDKVYQAAKKSIAHEYKKRTFPKPGPKGPPKLLKLPKAPGKKTLKP